MSWTVPSTTLPISDYDVRYRPQFEDADDPWDELAHEGTALSATISRLAYGVPYEVQLRASNPEGPGNWSASGTATTPLNFPPEFDEGAATTRNLVENSGSGVAIGDPVSASDRDDDTLTYLHSGTDAASFVLDGTTSQLRTKDGVSYDYEAKSEYEVTVAVLDGKGGGDSIVVTIEIDNVVERPTAPFAPTLTAKSPVSVELTWEVPEYSGRPSQRIACSSSRETQPRPLIGASCYPLGRRPSMIWNRRPNISNCLDCQADMGFQRARCLTMALRIVSSLRMQAVMATFFGLPASTRRV